MVHKTILIKEYLKKELYNLKTHERDSYGDVIVKLIKVFHKYANTDDELFAVNPPIKKEETAITEKNPDMIEVTQEDFDKLPHPNEKLKEELKTAVTPKDKTTKGKSDFENNQGEKEEQPEVEHVHNV